MIPNDIHQIHVEMVQGYPSLLKVKVYADIISAL